MNNLNFKQQLDSRVDLQHLLFRRGFVVSKKEFSMDIFPFYGNWKVENVNGYYFMTHRDIHCFHIEKNNVTYFLLGHSYNPFTMEFDEVKQLEQIADAYEKGKDCYWKAVDELTGYLLWDILMQSRYHLLRILQACSLPIMVKYKIIL